MLQQHVLHQIYSITVLAAEIHRRKMRWGGKHRSSLFIYLFKTCICFLCRLMQSASVVGDFSHRKLRMRALCKKRTCDDLSTSAAWIIRGSCAERRTERAFISMHSPTCWYLKNNISVSLRCLIRSFTPASLRLIAPSSAYLLPFRVTAWMLVISV